jgi:hypothetical protein
MAGVPNVGTSHQIQELSHLRFWKRCNSCPRLPLVNGQMLDYILEQNQLSIFVKNK